MTGIPPARRHHLVLLAVASLAVLLLSPGVARAGGDPGAHVVAARGSEVWSATMGVGADRGLLGYSASGERAVGTLTADTFLWGGTTYTVTNLLYNRSRRGAGDWRVLIDVSPALPEGFERLTLRLGDRWLNLADARGNGRQFSWDGVELDWRFRSAVPVSLREFPEAFEARSIAGRGNNRAHPDQGAAGGNLIRRAGVSYRYGLTASPPPELPGARVISNLVSVQLDLEPNGARATDMVWQWGQFLDHDISLTPEGSPAEALPIPVPRGDPVFDPSRTGRRTIDLNRSAFDPGTGTGPENPREQVNAISAFIDASLVYGSDPRRARALRADDGTGMLRTSGRGRLLPYNEEGLANEGGSRRTDLFLAGDVRANEQVGLTAMHTLFVREHNRLAENIASANPELHGHEIFELARKIVGAQMQVITYHEFLPLLLGPGALGLYGGYDPRVDPTIGNEFSTAAYRFGHTMLSPSLLHIDGSGGVEEVSLAEAFFNPALLEEHGISGLLRGLAGQQAQEVDTRLVDEVRNMLFGAPGGPVRDLAALNIQRGRDHGLPDYNLVRRAFGLPPAASFADVSSDPAVQEALGEAYGEIRYLDLWTGGLAEDHVPGAMLGETFHSILTEQFRRLRDGDRYWFENDPYFRQNPGLLDELGATTLADVIRRNTPIEGGIPDAVFGGPPPAPAIEAGEPGTPCLSGALAVGLSLVLYEGGHVDELEGCARSLHVSALWVLDDGAFVPLILGAPDLVNGTFRELFSDALPPGTPLLVRSEGPPRAPAPDGADPAGN